MLSCQCASVGWAPFLALKVIHRLHCCLDALQVVCRRQEWVHIFLIIHFSFSVSFPLFLKSQWIILKIYKILIFLNENKLLVLQSHISKHSFALTCMWMRDTFILPVMVLQLDPYVQAHKIVHMKKVHLVNFHYNDTGIVLNVLSNKDLDPKPVWLSG